MNINCCFSYNFIKRSLSVAANAVKHNKPKPLIICRHPKLDFYKGTKYKHLSEIPLASKGWSSKKSTGDYFVIHEDNIYDEWCENTNNLDFPSNLHPSLQKALGDMNITKPSWIQAQANDILLSRKHSVLAAETGCGKTLAYLLPLAQQLLLWEKPTDLNAPNGLIIVPNRELADQVSRVVTKLLQYTNLNCKVIIGGHTKRLMMNPTFDHIDLLISTPGALCKLSTNKIYNLSKVQIAILDEADTLLDDSFKDRLTLLLRRIHSAQLTLVSATVPKQLPPYLEHIENELVYVRSPLLHRTLSNVKHRFLRLSRSAKPGQLLQIMKWSVSTPTLIFTNKNVTCNWASLFLNENGINACNLNGDMHPDLRKVQWERYLNGTKILVTTDIASRGLDTSNIKHVINYDFPLHAADYIHRCGRTGRLGSPEACKITNFVSGPVEVHLVQQIEMAVRKGEPIPNVDGNIASIIRKREEKELNEV